MFKTYTLTGFNKDETDSELSKFRKVKLNYICQFGKEA